MKPMESDLYPPVKALLEGQGYVVKGEVRGCDVVAVRAKEPPVVVELKKAFSLALVMQGVDRLALTDAVYLAVGQWPKRMRNVKKLCKRLGLGFMVVGAKQVDIVLDPQPYVPRKNRRKVRRLLGEHERRVGDPNRGGSSTRVPMMTAYRQQALRCAELLASKGPMSPAAVRDAADAPKAVVALVHGYADYGERYLPVMHAWAEQGIASVAIDLRGHGHAEGPRGYCDRFEEFLDDASELDRLVADRCHGQPEPLVERPGQDHFLHLGRGHVVGHWSSSALRHVEIGVWAIGSRQ